MKSFLINTLYKVSNAGQHLDFISVIKGNEWIVFNDDKSETEKFMFVDNKKLIVSINGKLNYSKWEYIKINSSLVIDDDQNKYLLKIIAFNNDIIVINIDSTNTYSFLISSKSSVLKEASYENIQWYLFKEFGINILTAKQREKWNAQKKYIKGKEKEEDERKKQFFISVCKKIIFPIMGIVLIVIVVLLSKDYYDEYKKNHPIIYVTEEDKKDAVDLGLSVKWATCNVGANSPEDYGNYYGWGDVTGKSMSKATDSSYVLDYKFPPRETFDTIPLSIVDTRYDMAKVNWGDGWRLPTIEEVDELIAKCTMSEITLNNKNCYKVIGPNGHSIIFPKAGIRHHGEIYSDDGLCIWTGNLSNRCEYGDEHTRLAYALCLSDSTSANGLARIPGIKIELVDRMRWIGMSVRAVKDK